MRATVCYYGNVPNCCRYRTIVTSGRNNNLRATCVDAFGPSYVKVCYKQFATLPLPDRTSGPVHGLRNHNSLLFNHEPDYGAERVCKFALYLVLLVRAFALTDDGLSHDGDAEEECTQIYELFFLWWGFPYPSIPRVQR